MRNPTVAFTALVASARWSWFSMTLSFGCRLWPLLPSREEALEAVRGVSCRVRRGGRNAGNSGVAPPRPRAVAPPNGRRAVAGRQPALTKEGLDMKIVQAVPRSE